MPFWVNADSELEELRPDIENAFVAETAVPSTGDAVEVESVGDDADGTASVTLDVAVGYNVADTVVSSTETVTYP